MRTSIHPSRSRLHAAVRVALLAVAAGSLAASDLDAQVIGPEYVINPGPGIPFEPQIAAYGDIIVAVWGDAAEGVATAYSLDRGVTWTPGSPLARLQPSDDPIQAPSISVDGSGNFVMAVVYEPFPPFGHGIAIYRAELPVSGLVWTGPILAIQPVEYVSGWCGTPVALPRLAQDRESGNVYLVHAREGFDCEREVIFSRSTDGGLNWSTPATLSSGTRSTGAAVTVGPDGDVHVVWRRFGLGAELIEGRHSTDGGLTFGPILAVAEAPANPGQHPPGWWPPNDRIDDLGLTSGLPLGSEFPALAIDRSMGMHRGRMYAVWAERFEATTGPRTQLLFETDPNGDVATATPFVLGADIVGWLPDVHFEFDEDWWTFEADAGTTIHIDGVVSKASTPGARHFFIVYCELEAGGLRTLNVPTISTDGYDPPMIMTLPKTGRYYIRTYSTVPGKAYFLPTRVIAPGAGSTARDHRDIVLTWSDDGGQTWAPKVRVNDDAPLHDQSFPTVAVDSIGRVHVVWYDRRDQDCAGRVNTYWAMSHDGGQSFGPNHALSTASSTWFFQPGITNIGDRIGIDVVGDRVHVAWVDARHNPTSSVGGGKIFTVAIADLATSIAVPRFVAGLRDGRVEIAWTVRDAAGISGFRVHRDELPSGVAVTLPSPEVAGSGDYRIEDSTVEPGRAYQYRLEVIRATGSTWEGPVEVTLPGEVPSLALERMSPNPFATGTTITLAVPRAGTARLHAYDVTGHEVAEIHTGEVAAGRTSIRWEGTDRRGRPLPAGVYLIRAVVNGQSTTSRLIRMP